MWSQFAKNANIIGSENSQLRNKTFVTILTGLTKEVVFHEGGLSKQVLLYTKYRNSGEIASVCSVVQEYRTCVCSSIIQECVDRSNAHVM